MNRSAGFDYSFKIVTVGETGVGKTCFLIRYVRDHFEEQHNPTLGVEFLSKTMFIENFKIQLQIWDTAGQEAFRSVTRGYYRSAAGAVLVFDLTALESFNRLEGWLQEVKEVAQPDVVIILIGNKLDLTEQRGVSKEDAENFAQKHNLPYFETSTKDNINVSEVFDALVRNLLQKQISTPHRLPPTGFNNSSQKVSILRQDSSPSVEEKDSSCC